MRSHLTRHDVTSRGVGSVLLADAFLPRLSCESHEAPVCFQVAQI